MSGPRHRNGILLPGFVLLCASLVLLPAQVPAQVSSSSNSIADAFVTTGPAGINRSNNNYGGAGALGLAASGKPQGEFQTLLKFNLAGSVAFFNSTYGPGNWTVQSITLQLTAQNPLNPIFNASSAGSFGAVWQQNDSWLEGTGNPNFPTVDGVTFASLPALQSGADAALGTFSFNGATSGSFVYTLLLPPGFTDDINAGGDVSLRLFAADSNVSFLFTARNFGLVSSHPLLTVTVVPEPSAFVLLLIACGLGILARKRGSYS